MEKRFSEVMRWYIGYLGLMGVSPGTRRRYGYMAEKMITRFHNKVLTFGEISDRRRLGRYDVRRFKQELLASGMKPGAVRKYLDLGSLAIKRAWRELDWELPNPFDEMGVGLVSRPRERVLSADEERRLLIALTQPLRDFVLFALATGMRRSEIRGLTWDRVDFENREIAFRPEHHKSRRYDACALSTEAAEIVNRQPRTCGHVFSRKGKPLRDPWIGDVWRKALTDAGIKEAPELGTYGKRLRIHDLRRTMGYRLRDNGVPMGAIQAQLRHKDGKGMERVYYPARVELAKKYIQ